MPWLNRKANSCSFYSHEWALTSRSRLGVQFPTVLYLHHLSTPISSSCLPLQSNCTAFRQLRSCLKRQTRNTPAKFLERWACITVPSEPSSHEHRKAQETRKKQLSKQGWTSPPFFTLNIWVSTSRHHLSTPLGQSDLWPERLKREP